MGVCASCLGLGRRASQSDPSDSSHLLGDPYQPHYGGINAGGPHGGPQPAPEEIRRQRDALERICAQASDKLIDVSQLAYTEDGSKMNSEYPRLFNERFPAPKPTSRPSTSGTGVDEDEATWLGHIIGNSSNEEGSWDRVQTIDSGALTVQFDDALALDRKVAPGGR
ncbi:hypothetical protein K432DRAFT_445932 [Lepidopterella palustris CBS 459.81]|uniref:Late endosomal/lysosomal adaptor and MAPK and MTOR activator-domain-containing protein n=1 Tax=Lepidopterella palustris CBS 459.81 TaxID=1314670 RepID=A0A8E2E383_9PEZI|nr:hypothetical protein K432DRAFT_445932 [Lepidopterella palustris CBS 459.81]